MDYANPDALVSPEWLEAHLDAPDVQIVDATWFPGTAQRDAKVEFDIRHIPGAVFFDIDDVADTSVDLPHMLPSAEKFTSKVRKLGLGNGNRIIVYDGVGGFCAAARVWWMMRVFGHHDVAVLDGGLPRWMKEGRPVTDEFKPPRERHFVSRFNNLLVRNVDQMLANVKSGNEQMIDARSPKRFTGEEPEPRPNKRAGHIPGSINLPFGAFMDPKNDYSFLPADQIKAAFDKAGIDLNKPVAATCGSGVTACVPALAAYLIGHKDIPVYDGSWAEWGDREDLPME